LKRIILIVTIAISPLLAFAENFNVASPFSRYGYGDLQSASVGLARAMGGLGYGIRDGRVINPMNPASYSSIDSLTFMMNLGVSGTVNGINNGSTVNYKFKGRVDYVNFQFPLYKSLGLSFGLIPFSFVGYNYISQYAINDPSKKKSTTTVSQSFDGSGGFTQVYLGLSYDILNRVAIGVNGKYMFGEINNDRMVYFPNKALYYQTLQSSLLTASAFLCDIGLQYHQNIKRDEIVIGASYSIKLPMGMRSQIVTVTQQSVYDNTCYDFDFPTTIGVGASYRWRNNLLVGADFEWRDWSNARYYSVTDTLKSAFRVACGAEYVYKPGSKKYFEAIRYRLGANLSESYFQINGNRYYEIAVTAGLGFPLFSNLTTINVYFEYGHRGGLSTIGLVEDSFKFGLDISLNERWFVKRRLN